MFDIFIITKENFKVLQIKKALYHFNVLIIQYKVSQQLLLITSCELFTERSTVDFHFIGYQGCSISNATHFSIKQIGFVQDSNTP